MSKLIVLRTYDTGDVLVGDNWGETQFMTKEEYEKYIENLKTLKEEPNDNR